MYRGSSRVAGVLVAGVGVAAASVVVYRLYHAAERPLSSASEATQLCEAELRTRAAAGGVAPSLRVTIWALLLRLPPLEEVEASYAALLQQCDTAPDTPARAEALRTLVADVRRASSPCQAALTRLLRCYALEDEAVGYAQGMADIACVFQRAFLNASEALCYAAFAAFIRQHRATFLRDLSAGLLPRLARLVALLRRADPPVWAHIEALGAADCVFAVRPVAVLLLRELGERDAARLWDAAMAHQGDDYLLAAAAAALLQRRSQLLAADGLDGLLRAANGMAGALSLRKLLARTAELHAQLTAMK